MMPNLSQQGKLKQTIDELTRVAWEVRVNDSDLAYKKSIEAVELSRQINYTKGLADGLCIQGFGCIRKSDFAKATNCLEEANILYQSLNDVRGLAVINEYFGIIQRNQGNSAAALRLIFKALELSQQTGFIENEVTNLYQLGVTYRHLANYDKALEYLFNSLSIAKAINLKLMEAYDVHIIGSIYFETGDYHKALNYYELGLNIRQLSGDKWGEAGSLDNIGFTYLKLNDYQNAIDYCKKSLDITIAIGDKKGQANTLLHLAEIYKQNSEEELAAKFSNESLQIRKENADKRGEAEILLFLAGLQNINDSNSLECLFGAVRIADEIKANDLLSKARFKLYEYYRQNRDFKEAIVQLEEYINLETELHKNTIEQKVLNLETSYKAEETKKETEAIRLKNEELTKLNTEIEEQKKKLEEVIANLKATQQQLIQSEKMASLGELTAGIAHEIQNPLNFVNNFSEINTELIDEADNEMNKGNISDAKIILNEIKENEQKIVHHGKRADAIVKGMLQHSRRNNGVKELTDINALVDEYLRLAYHGLRAKDKSFNATMKTDFDVSIGNINIIPQDIGRVMLNLINNAFYAVDEKKKHCQSELVEDFEPTVSVSTKKNGDKVLIGVKDNGNGIPQKALDKIFQPFFTTKPAGSGTGLGLSLSYDIVKAHGGEIKLETSEGEGSEFIIQLTVA